MRKIIYNLRQQPEKVRRHILHIVIMIFGAIFFVVWVYTLGVNLSSEETKKKAENDLKPLSALKDNLVSGYKSIQDTDSAE